MNSIFAKISCRENISNSLFAKFSSRENKVLYSISSSEVLREMTCGAASHRASLFHYVNVVLTSH